MLSFPAFFSVLGTYSLSFCQFGGKLWAALLPPTVRRRFFELVLQGVSSYKMHVYFHHDFLNIVELE